jgi:hypothetical protein
MAREIIVTVDAQGNTVVTTTGFSGAECLKATAELEKALGATTKDTKTREFSGTPNTAQSVNKQGR